MADLLQLKLFGTPQITYQDQAVTGFISAKVRALLIYLAVTQSPHSRAALAELLWADTPVTARKNLKKALSNLRHLSGIPLIEQADGAVLLEPQKVWVDVRQFEQAARQASANDTTELQSTVQLYHADFLSGFNLSISYEFEAWALSEQNRLKEQKIALLQRLVAAYAAVNEPAQAIATLRHWLEVEPWREDIHRQLMTALARQGNRSAALLQFELCRTKLNEELAVEPDATTLALVQQIRQGEFDPAKAQVIQVDQPITDQATPPAAKHNLPAPTTPLIGRTQEGANVAKLLTDASTRLITILGAGGMGKTHLALHLAWQQIEQFADGIYWVALAPVSEASGMISTIATTLGLHWQGGRTPQQQLSDFLQGKHLLLCLDNFEQVNDGAPMLHELLTIAPRLSILVTSRQRLGLHSETIFRLDGLPFPATEETNTADYAAVQLFLQQTRQVLPSYQPTPQELAGIVQICRLVEGMPLGILLAAVWVNLLSPQEIAQEIRRDFTFLQTELQDIPARQRSLRLVFTHTWQRLREAERAVLMRLSVFGGGCTRQAAEQVAGATLPVLATLCDKALLWRTAEGRYEIHELLRQFAAEELAAAGITASVEAAHCRYFMELLGRSEMGLKGGDQGTVLDELKVEAENLQRAWRWAVQTRNIDHLSSALDGFMLFYRLSGRQHEGEKVCHMALEVLQSDSTDITPNVKRLYARLLTWLGWFTHSLGQTVAARQKIEQGLALLEEVASAGQDVRTERAMTLVRLADILWYVDVEQAQQMLAESLTLYRAISDVKQIALVLRELARACWSTGDLCQSKIYGEESLALRRASNDYAGVTQSIAILIWTAQKLGRSDQTLQYGEEFYAISRQIGSQEVLTQALFNLAMAHLFAGNYGKANNQLEQARRLAIAIGNRPHANYCTILLADTLIHLGDYQQAAVSVQSSLQVAAEMNQPAHRADVMVQLASLQLIDGNYAEAIASLAESILYTRQSQHFVKVPRLLALLGQTVRAMNNHLDAHRYRDEALQLAYTQENIEALALILPLTALLLLDEGHSERAVEVYAAATTHPYVANSRWFAEMFGKQIAQAASALPSSTVAAAEKRGRTQGLQETARMLLHEQKKINIDLPPTPVPLAAISPQSQFCA